MPTTTYPRGSEWRKWDLHIHSPLSALNNQFPKLTGGEPDWEKYVTALESLTDISVIGITDYFTVEGYRKVREYKNQGRLAGAALVLPNIEYRLDKIINTGNGPRRINYHVLFSETLSPDEIEEHFLQELKFHFEGDPQRPDFHLSVRRTNLELLGKQLKSEHPAFNDHRSDFEIGCMNATVDPSEIKRVLHNKEKIFKGKYLIFLAEEHLGLLDWNGQDHLTRKILLQGADGIFSANPGTIAWTRGDGHLNAEEFEVEFKTLKPCLHGSDAHRLADIGKPALDRYCWIKAETTFEGLKQVLYEPHERIYIGERPANLKDFADWFYSIEDFAVTYSIKFDGKDLHLLSPGEKGIVLLLLYLEAENEDHRPLIIDQPDDNLDNVSVYPSLIEYFRTRKKTRQVIIITHNPNRVVNTDAEQVFIANFDGSRSPKIAYRSGALEDTNPTGPVLGIREEVCKILEGGTKAFQLREQRYAIT